MNFLKKQIAKSKAFFAFIAIASILAGVLAPLATAKADNAVGPRLNVLPDDLKTLRGGDKTKGELSRSSIVTGMAGDTISGLIYIHNGVVNTTANNTKVKISIPAKTSGNKAQVSVTVSSDNSENTVVDSMEINLNEDATLTYVPGSVEWFPNFTDVNKPKQTLPFNQTGDEIITTNGLNIGNINGCWQYINYVYFMIKTDKVAQKIPSLRIEKTVRDFTVGATDFVKANEANPGDVLEYKIAFSNSGTGNADNVTISDVLPTNVTYLANSTILHNNSGEKMVSDGVTQSGIGIGTISVGESGYVKFKAVINASCAADQYLVNTGYIIYSKDTLSDTAKTKIIKTVITISTPSSSTSLPKTGAETFVIVGMVMVALYTTMTYLKKRKELANLLK